MINNTKITARKIANVINKRLPMKERPAAHDGARFQEDYALRTAATSVGGIGAASATGTTTETGAVADEALPSLSTARPLGSSGENGPGARPDPIVARGSPSGESS